MWLGEEHRALCSIVGDWEPAAERAIRKEREPRETGSRQESCLSEPAREAPQDLRLTVDIV